MNLKKSKAFQTLMDPIGIANPISVLILGICSSLAVTTQLIPALVMTVSMTFVLASSNVVVSLLRHSIPKNIRIIVELTVISSLVILADQVLKAYLFDVSKMLSVFVGLIITNCIIMGRAEAFALSNGPWLSFWDGVGNGLGYGWILIAVAFFRELLGSGTVFGWTVIPPALYEMGYHNMGFMVLAPGAFIVIGLLTWAQQLMMKKK